MYLRDALGGVEDVDPTRPLSIGSLELGEEAAAVAHAILNQTETLPVVSLSHREFRRPVYWTVDHSIEGRAQIAGFPPDWKDKLPTAIEVALVRAISALPPNQHSSILTGGIELVLGSENACEDFRKVAAASENPMAGSSTVFKDCFNARIVPPEGINTKVALLCLSNSYVTTPLKFRFLELYRVMEALFLADVKRRLMETFDSEPTSALSGALSELQSELNQITRLAEPHSELFEKLWDHLDALKVNNHFVSALFRRLAAKKLNGGGKAKVGVALIYQIRCAVVHAGEKEMIFEKYADGDIAITAILPTMERAALAMLGITLA